MAIQLIEQALCTVDDVRAAIDNAAISTERDDAISLYINYFTEFAEKFCDRYFLKTYREMHFDGQLPVSGGARKRLFIKATPIDREEEIVVWDDPTREFSDEKYKLTKYVDYGIDWTNGIIKLFCEDSFYDDFDNLRVDCTAGLITTLTEPSGYVPWDLRGASAQQVAHWWRISNDPGAVQISGIGGGQITMFRPTEILPAVKAVLQSYKRMVY